MIYISGFINRFCVVKPAFSISVCFLLLLAFPNTSFAKDRPNVLLIVTDEHNFRTLGCYRALLSEEQAEMWGPDSIVETPNLDRLAAEGVICTRAYATAPVCSPCRAAMVTGLYPHHAGVPTNNFPLRGDVPTLATLLNDEGYRTAFLGKWHLGGDGKPEWSPKVDGGFKMKRYMFNRGHWKKFSMTAAGAEIASLDNRGKPSYSIDNADASSFSTDFLTDRALSVIEAEEESPFLMVVSYPDPHGPNTVRAPYDVMYQHMRFLAPRTYGRDDVLGPRWLSGGKNHAVFRGEQMSLYFGMVKCIDDNVGRLLDALRQSGKIDSTVIMMTSDHGDLCYEHDRLNKGNPYEGSARVPMLIRYPNGGVIPSVYAQPMGTVDVTPTILGLLDLESTSQFQGRDLSPDFRSVGQGKSEKMAFLRNSGTQANWIAAVDARYKLVLSVNDRPWLFDQDEDPDELINFYGRPGTVAVTNRLARGLSKYSSEVGDPFLEHPKISSSLRECLK